jgi:hypothetical protein
VPHGTTRSSAVPHPRRARRARARPSTGGPPVVCSRHRLIVAGTAPAPETSLTSSPRPAVTAAIAPEVDGDGAGEAVIRAADAR